MTEKRDLKTRILEDAPRLAPEDKFSFSCHPGVSCFNNCCADINIVLTPYDIIRLKNRLGITSPEFHEKYSLVPFSKEINQPTPVIKMLEDVEGKPCPFVGEKGCTVYEDRPWACRMYPVGMAAPRDQEEQGDPFFFLLEEDFCKGHKEDREITIKDWIRDQGVQEYDDAGELFAPVSLHPFWDRGDLSPAKMDMFFMAAYNLDRFRRFLFESSFFTKFVVDAERIEKLRTDDYELMRFGFEWLRFALFEETGMKLHPRFKAEEQKEHEFFKRKQ